MYISTNVGDRSLRLQCTWKVQRDRSPVAQTTSTPDAEKEEDEMQLLMWMHKDSSVPRVWPTVDLDMHCTVGKEM